MQFSKSSQTVIGFVGLPCRGKTFYARRLVKYLSWLGYSSRVFNLGNYRRESVGLKVEPNFFDHHNNQGLTLLRNCSGKALQDLISFLQNGGDVAIYDATNTTKEKRSQIYQQIMSVSKDIFFMWIECICTDENLIMQLIKVHHNNPDFCHLDEQAIVQEVFRKIENFGETYQSLHPEEGVPYVKVMNLGSDFEIHNITGYLPSKCLSFLMNLRVLRKPIYLSRHGESLYNLDDRVGGDPDLSENGYAYARMLQNFFKEELTPEELSEIQVLTSTLKRAIITAEFTGLPVVSLKNLDEINVGVCDGMTYKEIEEQLPFESQERNLNKLAYRYPRGESYLDLIQRVEPIIYEIESCHQPVIVVAHQAVLRCIYSYFKQIQTTEIPFLSIPHNSVMKLIPQAYVCKEDRFNFDPKSNTIKRVQICKEDMVYVEKFSQL